MTLLFFSFLFSMTLLSCSFPWLFYFACFLDSFISLVSMTLLSHSFPLLLSGGVSRLLFYSFLWLFYLARFHDFYLARFRDSFISLVSSLVSMTLLSCSFPWLFCLAHFCGSFPPFFPWHSSLSFPTGHPQRMPRATRQRLGQASRPATCSDFWCHRWSVKTQTWGTLWSTEWAAAIQLYSSQSGFCLLPVSLVSCVSLCLILS